MRRIRLLIVGALLAGAVVIGAQPAHAENTCGDTGWTYILGGKITIRPIKYCLPI